MPVSIGLDIYTQYKLKAHIYKIIGWSDHLAWGQQFHFIGSRRN